MGEPEWKEAVSETGRRIYVNGSTGEKQTERPEGFGQPAAGDTINIEDTNMAGVGSEEDRAQRKAAAETDPEWKGAGKAPGIEVWRVENKRTAGGAPDFGVKRWPKERYGEFHKGDSYIVLHTKKVEGGKLIFDIHFCEFADGLLAASVAIAASFQLIVSRGVRVHTCRRAHPLAGCSQMPCKWGLKGR
eukprot:GHVU01174054.1.p1 GENE.GHVU01174054.1~~GHVU01174054.1.p1  ORF type:complete len:189 (+),score=34.33 GHVU01174054.1:42-608(+)